MKKLLFIAFLFVSFSINAQTIDEIVSPYMEADPITGENLYVTYWSRLNPPYGYKKVVIQKDSTYIYFGYEHMMITGYGNTRNDGRMTNILATDSDGKILSCPKDSLFIFKSQVVDFPVLFSGAYGDLTGNPALFSGAYSDLTGKPTLFSGAYTDLTGKPALFSGSYTDLSNKPSIPSAQVNSDWTASSGLAEILHKPTLFSGVYSDLTGKPSLFSGSYTDLTSKPSTFPPSSHSHIIADVTGLQAALDGKLSSEVDGSITNEIELPSQTGNNGKVLSTNGTSPSWSTPASGSVTSVATGTGLSGGPITGTGTISLANTAVTAGTYNGTYTVDAQGRLTAAANISRTSTTASRSLVTTTASTGFRPSATLDYAVSYSVYAQVTSALAGTNTADVYLEVAATNSTTPGDWTTICRSGISLAGVLSTSGNTQTVSGFIPAGYYVRIRTAATGANAGSANFLYQVGQENSY